MKFKASEDDDKKKEIMKENEWNEWNKKLQIENAQKVLLFIFNSFIYGRKNTKDKTLQHERVK